MNPRVSVVMPVYNGAATVRRAVDSVLCQTWRDLELVAVDDGSTDGTADVLNACVEADDRVRVVRNPSNQGIAPTLNTGTNAARGEWLAHIDADDEWVPDKLRKQMEFVEDHPDVGLLGTWSMARNAVTGDTQMRRAPVSHEQVLERIWTRCPFNHSAIVVRKALLDRVGGYDCSFAYAEDHELYFRLAFETRTHNLPEPLCTCETHRPDNVTMRRWKDVERCQLRAFWKYYRRHRRPWYTYMHLVKPLLKQLVPRPAKRWKQQIVGALNRSARESE
ncbi:MAG: glycosyltransferase [bacterium]|nr:glycosyltransferase [bacterium]